MRARSGRHCVEAQVGQVHFGRSGAWLKLKCRLEQELSSADSPAVEGSAGIGALLLGYYEKGKLRYAGAPELDLHKRRMG